MADEGTCKSIEEISESLNFSDCALWPVHRSNKVVDYILKMGPNQVILDKYPIDEKGRHFSSFYYNRKLPNGEVFPRCWLIYSTSKNAVFCFCCRLFERNKTSNLAENGFNNWKKLSETLRYHENSAAHKNAYQQWIETKIRMQTGKTIDKEEQKLIEKESARWQSVLERLISITLYLGINNMAFRGSSDKLYKPNNGKFLGLVQLLAKFDPVMSNHVTLALNGDISDHYCGKIIQNELIDLVATKITSTILARASLAIYFAIIADCTPDISHKEQLSLTIRFVDISTDIIEIKEHFIGFFTVDDSTGFGLSEIITDTLIKFGLKLSDCRGQGYDNGANMKGKNVGVQKRILELNPLASYVPCGSHSLNLVLCDAAKSSLNSVNFFGIIQRLFTLFSASTYRWSVLTSHAEIFALKTLSDTRWEAKIESLKAIRYQISSVHDALITLNENEKKSCRSARSNHLGRTIRRLWIFGIFNCLVRCIVSSQRCK